MPFFKVGKKVRVAVEDPENDDTKKLIAQLEEQGFEVNINLASSAGITDVMKIFENTQQYKKLEIVDEVEEKSVDNPAHRALIRKAGGEARVVGCDITDVAAIKETFGALGTVDIVVNNAGTHEARLIEAISAAEFKNMMDVHVKGAFFTVQTLLPDMKERRGGKIINTASAWGQCGWHTDSHYCGAKAAILGLTKAWAKEFAPWGITGNAVAPGYIDTPMMDGLPDEVRQSLVETTVFPKRLGHADEYAALAKHIAENRYINGTVIRLDGALRMAPR